MRLKNYNRYLITEAEKGEKKTKLPEQKMIFSEKFREVLKSIQNIKQSNISKRLLELESPSSERLFDISYIDVDPDGENVTFLQSNRIIRLKNEEKPEDEFWKSKMRTKQKVGRFIKDILPNFNEESIQKFSKKYKSIIKESEEEINFELVEGNDIIYWYDYRNYENNNGTLGSSCMSGPDAGQYLNCYRNNPEQCKMLILKNSQGNKIKGRAIVWKLSEPKDLIFMDRIYTNNENDEILFTNYAKKQGWSYKNQQRYGYTSIVTPEGVKNLDMNVILDNINYDMYPYVDTLRYYYPDKKMMSNLDNIGGLMYTLTDTEGHYEEWHGDDDDDYDDPMVHDDYNNVDIPESRATWCRYDAGYINTDDAIRLSYNNEYAFPKSPHIVWSDYTKKWYAKDDCEFSKPLNTWIWKKYLVDVYHDKNRSLPPDKIHRFELNKSIGKVDEYYYDINLLQEVDKKQVPGKDPKKFKTEITYKFKE